MADDQKLVDNGTDEWNGAKRRGFTVSVLDVPAFHDFLERVRDFVDEYATHHRNCRAVDADGDWRIGNPTCDCGYDEALTGLAPPAKEAS